MIIVVLLSVIVWAPLLYPGFVQTHSGLGAVYDALAAGGPLSGWMPAYGTPGDGPLATWLLALVQAAIGALAALKLLYALSFILAGLGMFLLARRLWCSLPAFVAAAVYMLLPYRLVTVYVRGALAESLLLAVAPFLLLALWNSAHSPRKRNLLLVGLASLILALLDAGLGVLVTFVAVIWYAMMPWTSDVSKTPDVSRGVWKGALAAAAGLALALLILLPAGGRMFANMPEWNEHFVYTFQLFSPTWGFGESVPGWQDSMSFQLGLIAVGLAFLALWGAYESEDARQRRTVIILAGLAGLLAFLSLTIAAPLWRVIPLAAFVAYPWQLLGLAGIPLALLAGAAAHTLMPSAKPESLTIVAVLLAATVLSSYSYLAPRFMNEADIPDLTHPPLAQLGDDILLLDAQADKEAAPGGNVTVTVIWQALHQPGADFTTYVHLVDATDAMYGQQDTRPQKGERPTNTWLRGEVVRDVITLPVKADAPPGEYRLAVGMYLLATMERLPVVGSDQSDIVLGPITVK